MISEFFEAVASHAFLQRALITACLIGISGGVIGSFVILRGLSLMGDAIGHAVLPGVAISFILGINPVIGAVVFGLLASTFIGVISDKSTLKKDTVMGVVFTSFFAFGVVLISQIRSSVHIHSVLFGNMLTVTPERVYTMSFVTIVLIGLVVLFYKELLLTSFDETMAQVHGLKTKLIHYLFLFVLTVVIVLSLQITGAILIVAMIITPAATAFLLTNRMYWMIIVAALIGFMSAVIGIFISFTYDISSGSSIVIIAACLFVLAFIFVPKKGVIAQGNKKFKQRMNRIKND